MVNSAVFREEGAGAAVVRTHNAASAPKQQTLGEELRKDIAQLLKLAANTLDAHSVFLLLPSHVLQSEMFGSFSSFPEYDEGATGSSTSTQHSPTQGLTPFASQTLSPKALPKKQAPVHAGPILWVARTGKPLHISPFEMDATGLGVYGTAVPLKSLAAVPVSCEGLSAKMSRSSDHAPARSVNSPLKRGVLVVDSLKAYKFTPLQVKLLQQLGSQIERILELHEERLNLLRERLPLSSQQALSSQYDGYREESSIRFETSELRDNVTPQSHPKKFKAQIEALLREQDIKTLSVASISLSFPSLSFSANSVASNTLTASPVGTAGKQTTGKAEKVSSEQKLGKRLLTHYFPVQQLLTLPQQIQEVWESSIRDFHEFLESDANVNPSEGSDLFSTPSRNQVASLVASQEIILVCDHLRMAMLTKKIRGLFLFYLRKRLQFAIEDPREATFEAITQELLTAQTTPLKTLTGLDSTTHEHGCLGRWLQYVLAEGVALHSVVSQNPKASRRKWGWLRSDSPKSWTGSSKTSENIGKEGKGRGLFARSSFSLGRSPGAIDTSIQTLRHQSSIGQDQPLHRRRVS